MALIPFEEISFSSLSTYDELGRLFRWKGKIYRGIYPGKAESVRRLFASGCLDELAKRGLFPRSRITDDTLEGFSLIVGHEEIPLVVYPYEWSFDMLRDAALAALKVIEVSAKFGWDLSDIHPFNVVFRGGRPLYVDLGSFRPLPVGKKGQKGSDYHRFVKTFWRPLALWASGDSFLARSILSSREACMPDVSWWLYRNSTLRAISPRFSIRLARRVDRWWRKGARLLHPVRIFDSLPGTVAGRLPVELLTRNPRLLYRKIARLKQPLPTEWDNDAIPLEQGEPAIESPRAGRLLEMIRAFLGESVTELSGQQGLFSLRMAAQTQVRKLVCVDRSSRRINEFYQRSRQIAPQLKGCYLQGAVFDFMSPEMTFGMSSPSERLRADTVVALDSVSHLILVQRFQPREILTTLAAYTRRHIVVEFMPSGVQVGKKLLSIPVWYTTNWFHQQFAAVFDVVAVKQLELNRIIFVGRLKANSAPPKQPMDPPAFVSSALLAASFPQKLRQKGKLARGESQLTLTKSIVNQ